MTNSVSIWIMEVQKAIRYVTLAPNKTNAAIKATPKFLRGYAQELSGLPNDAFERADSGVRQIATQASSLKALAIKNGKLLAPARPSRDPIGAPAQTGWISQRTAKAKNYPDEAAAKEAFRTQSEALLRPAGWNDNTAGLTFADAPTWHLLDAQGKPEHRNRRIQKGDILRIDAPGPDFFVRAERVHIGTDNVGFTVVPCGNPNAQGGPKTAHFFTDDSSRTFTLQRDGNEVRFVTEGNNERLNVAGQSGFWKAPWNAASGAGIMAGIGQVYWNSFASGLMEK